MSKMIKMTILKMVMIINRNELTWVMKVYVKQNPENQLSSYYVENDSTADDNDDITSKKQQKVNNAFQLTWPRAAEVKIMVNHLEHINRVRC